MDAIRTDALTKHYTVGFWRPRPYVALDALTLQVAQGEVFGFLGPNGAGKTTTLKLLMQLMFPSSGYAEILGRPVGDVGVRRRLGYLPENPYFYDYLTAEELLGYFATLFGIPAHERRRRVSTLLDDVGIQGERRLQLRKFSKGMLQRVGIAQALINEPEIVFFDEPMSGLDPLGRREIRELILRLRDRGCTVFFSSHVLADAEALCNRVAMLAGGRLVALDDLSGLQQFRIRGWELVVSGLGDALRARLRADGSVTRETRLGEQRYALELPPEREPERLLPELLAQGARVVSLQPLRDTLEDLFVRQVGAAAPRRPLDGADR
jgi:ABC-2 type transport system ATP-binding protein